MTRERNKEEMGFEESPVGVTEKEEILGYKTGAGFFCANCFQERTDKVEKTITDRDLKVFFFFCDDCGDKICKKKKDS
jgi:hypothetical protein